jgi:CubicO group peptidase (beta-lactamase class C family)
MKKILLITLLTLLSISCKKAVDIPQPVSNTTNSLLDSLTITLDSIARQSPIAGFSVAILTKDTVLYNKGFGYANMADSLPYTHETIQNIGSISKTFIGIALLKAQELGKLKLDDPINKYLPFTVINPNHKDKLITIRQLATHTSSVTDTDWYGKSYVMLEKEHPPTTKVFGYFSGPESGMSLPEYLKKVLTPKGAWYEPEIFSTYAPGAKFNYSNIGAALVALVLEGAVGTSFIDFTQRHIFTPLEMTATGWSNATIDITKRSKLYVHKDTLIAPYRLLTYPDGGLITSTDNLSRYLSELMDGYQGKGILLAKESYQALFKKQLTKDQLPEGHTEGNSGIFMDYGKHGIGHNGGDPGITAFMYFNEEATIGKILFINTDYDDDPTVLKTFGTIWKTLGQYETKLQVNDQTK